MASTLTEWKPLSYNEKKPALLNQRRHRKRSKRESSLVPKSKLSSSPLEKKLQQTQLSSFRLFVLSTIVFGITYWLSSVLLPVSPELSPSLNHLTTKGTWLRQIPHIALSLGTALLTVAILIYLRTRLISHQVDVLCRQFLSYRREHEEGELEISRSDRIRSGIDLRIMMLKELWDRFQKSQDELARNFQEIELSKEQLEKTVASLKKAKEQERRLVELGYAVAEFGHDIGNANGSILSFSTLVLKMLEKDAIHPMDLVRSLTFIRRIKQSSINISGLTGDIVEFAKGKMELHPERLNLEDFKEQLDAQLGFVGDLRLEYVVTSKDQMIPLKIDYRKICRVIVNLVKNSWEKLQDDEDDGLIQVRMSILQNKDLQIQVYDNGTPIPENIVNNLFEAFRTEGKQQGTGLGLAICQKLVDLHGGLIRGRNLNNGIGVIFEILLPDCVLIPLTGKNSQETQSGKLPHPPSAFKSEKDFASA